MQQNVTAFLMHSRAALAIHIMFYPHSDHFPYEKFLFLGRRNGAKRDEEAAAAALAPSMNAHEEQAQRVCLSIKSLVVRTQRRKATCYRSSCSKGATLMESKLPAIFCHREPSRFGRKS